MKQSIIEFNRETNTIYGQSHMFDIAIVTFTHASTKGSGKRKSSTKVIICVESDTKEQHFKKWSKLNGYINATLIEWDSFGIAWLSPKTLDNPKKIGKLILKECPHLSNGTGKYDLSQYQPNQWVIDVSAQVKTEVLAYSYETVRGQKRIYEKNVVCFKDQSPQEVFRCWTTHFNKTYSFKELRNVQILCDSIFKTVVQ